MTFKIVIGLRNIIKYGEKLNMPNFGVFNFYRPESELAKKSANSSKNVNKKSFCFSQFFKLV